MSRSRSPGCGLPGARAAPTTTWSSWIWRFRQARTGPSSMGGSAVSPGWSTPGSFVSIRMTSLSGPRTARCGPWVNSRAKREVDVTIAPRALSVALARGIGALSRRLGRGGGTSAPGRVLLWLRPKAIQELASTLTRGSLVISATNGKTTTGRLIGSCVATEGWRTVSNRAGANLVFGVATALLDAVADEPCPEFGLFEVDEFALPE